MAELNPKERRYKRDQILIYLGQLLHRETTKEITTPQEVAKLAVELAQLNGAKDAKKFANEAVWLLRECRDALKRPSPGALTPKQANALAMQAIVSSLASSLVPYAQLVTMPGQKASTELFSIEADEGERMKWQPYRGEKAFIKLLWIYASNHYDNNRERLIELITATPPRASEAKDFVKGYTNGNADEEIALIEEGFPTTEDAQDFAKQWAVKATNNFVGYLRSEAKAGNFDTGTVRALLKLRNKRNTLRNRKVTANRETKPTKPKA